ncbi:MAG: hypothetical protein H0T18_00195 [Chloroflexia bacterium]|nr:hypothetical protein [Chloroflexia bacterium]
MALVAPSTQTPRTGARLAPQAAPFTREAEFAYIRADMRRLLIIAGALLALMVLIQIVVGR